MEYKSTEWWIERGKSDYAGGVPGSKKVKGVIPGGMSMPILPAGELDVPMANEFLSEKKTLLGTGGIVVMDETTCIVGALESAAKFFAEESCGQCSPCREGTDWVHRILRRITAGEGRLQDLDDLLAIASDMEGNTICVFADAAAWPIQSYIGKFRDEFEEYIRSGRRAESMEAAACLS